MGHRTLAAAALAVLIGACATVPSRCPVAGERASLAGTWDGEFAGDNSDRNGTIHFELKAGQDSAYGDVMLVLQQWTNAARISGSQPAPRTRLPRVIRISFVYVANDQVRGTLDDYFDPACGCTLKTVFDGMLSDHVIKGTYETQYSRGGLAATGKWTVRRVSSELHARVDRGDALR